MRPAAARQGQRREDRDPEACAIEPLDPERQHVAVESERQHSKGGAVIAGRPKNGTGMPSFIFWSASNARCVPRRSAVIARLAPTAPFGMNSPRSLRNRAIMRSISGLLAAR